MFGSNKPFGTASAFGASSFGNTSTPFGQSTNTFGAKPATGNVFGSSSFGVSTPSQPISGGLFGSSTPATGTGLFGQQTTAFGAPASTSTGGFGGFGVPSNTNSLFGSSTPSTQSSGGLFGNTSNSAFGTPRPGFGGFNASTPGTGLFGQNTNTGTGMFGSAGGFNATAATSGTTIKFNPPTGTDTMIKGGTSTNISTRHQCITCMKEYENKSLEELRMEDYAANRKGGAGSAVGMGFGTTTQPTGGLFGGNAAASTSAFSFGSTTQSKPMFGTTGATNTFGTSGGLFGQPAQTQNTGLFGKSVGFGAPTAAAAPAFSFGASTGTSLFGQNNQQKPLFGQTTGGTGLFGSTATTQQSTGFGTNTAFGAFGANNQQTTGLFGAKPTGFGTTNTTTTNSFSFGNTNAMSAGGGLFGQKPAATAFGTGTTAFGTPSSGFGAFGATPATGTGLFGQTKPAGTAFGTTGSMFGGGLGTSFGNPSFSMGGLGTNTGTGLFGGAQANKPSAFNFGNTGSTGFNFGATNPATSSFNFGMTPAATSNDPNNLIAIQQAQQQILAMTVNPYGDSPLFRNSIKDSSRETEVLKPTNPSAQKALLNDNHYKVAALPTAKIKPKPWSPAPTGKMLLFDGLEDEEPSLGAAFVPKKSIKKLVLKNNNSQSSLTLTSTVSPSQSTRIDVSISLNNPKNSDKRSDNSPLTVDISNSSANDMTETRRSIVRPDSPVQNIQTEPFISPRVDFNTSLNDSIAQLHSNKQPVPSLPFSDWSSPEKIGDGASLNTSNAEKEQTYTVTTNQSHPTKIILTDPSYYTIPSLDEMIPFICDETCIVKDFVVGRTGYGQVIFPGDTDVYGLNLDEIVSFGKKEINVYPDDNKKPPLGQGLNRKAKVILKNVWPNDKTSRTLVQDPERILKMGYREKIEKCTAQIGATFIDYKPETGTWIFEVDHFSKYGLEDSDEEMDVPKQPEKKTLGNVTNQKDQLCGNFLSGDSLAIQQIVGKPLSSFNLQDQEMEVSSQMMSYPTDFLEDEDSMFEMSNQQTPILTSGIDVHRIQDMKASFFQDMDEENWEHSAFNKKPDIFKPQKKDFGLEETLFKSKKFDTFSNEVSKRLKSSDKDENQMYTSFVSPYKFNEMGVQSSLSALSLSTEKVPEWMTDYPIVKSSSLKLSLSKPIPSHTKIFLKPFHKSTLYDKQHILSDAGFFMGHSFRVGWAGNGKFALADTSEKNPFENYKMLFYDPHTHGKTSHCRSNFIVSVNDLTSYSLAADDPQAVQKIIVNALENQLEHSLSEMEGEAPLFIPKPGIEPIHSHAELFESILKDADSFASQADFIRQCVYVWDLLVSLWGKVVGLDEDQNVTSYANQMARREALSRWLIKTTERDISKKASVLSHREDYLVKIFLYLNSRRTTDAVKLAQINSDFRLSLLLSQAESNSIVRNLLAKQLLNWKENGAYNFIKYDRIVLYALLSGILVFEDVNCCKDLSWKQVLSLQLWYYCNPNASVQDAVKEYDESFQGTSEYGRYASPPYPSYLDASDMSEISEEDSSNIFDTCYHLLKLYCDRSHRFDMLLMPETYSPDHLDYRLSWLLHLALSSVGYHIPDDIANTLHMNFASQLESLGLWEWAIFVLLYHTDTQWRSTQVKDILLRCISLESNADIETKEKFLTERLKVPENWLFEAKAIKANTSGKKAEEAWYLLKAGSWSKSHQIVIKNLAPSAIINEDFEFLMKYLSEFAVPERSATIIDWASGGQVYLDYINMCQVVQDVVSRETSAYDLENFTPQVISLCKRLSSLPATTLNDRLSIAEMAKKTATILRSISILQATRTKNSSCLTSLASYIKDLPMPYDYAASENRFVAHQFLEEITADI
ncbi:hypothetical protein JTE90_012136 [Oedothorax gibbosus]|uniref:Nuclear pore complex protein Nup98-Nup96 n=1 Tax=Oedothorax gibbosus TaxID=931172 RepID=A0AAV6U9K9_9ARAC|nr:hypothetical protein JTE90_012136 [Oedothorax gibbosus]